MLSDLYMKLVDFGADGLFNGIVEHEYVFVTALSMRSSGRLADACDTCLDVGSDYEREYCCVVLSSHVSWSARCEWPIGSGTRRCMWTTCTSLRRAMWLRM